MKFSMRCDCGLLHHISITHELPSVPAKRDARTPGPATKVMLEWAEKFKGEYGPRFRAMFEAFLDEWKNP